MNNPEEAYEKVVGVKPSPLQLARWSLLKRHLDISAGDALWSIVIVLETYNVELELTCETYSRKLIRWLKVVSSLLILQLAASAFVAFRMLR